MPLTTERVYYKPFEYPIFYEFWRRQNAVHWLPEEVALADDVADFKNKLTPAEKNLVVQILRFFTQSDLEISNCYHTHYLTYFKIPEVRMMLTAFSAMETVHVAAYSHLTDTLGLPEIEYQAFLGYKEMRDKFDWIRSFEPTDKPEDIALHMAAFSGATEGMSLFASFAILLNFPRFNKLKGMGDIIRWSVRDESMHCEGIAALFHTFMQEHPEINRERLQERIGRVFFDAVRNEDKFIDLAFEMGPIDGLDASEMKKYIRFIADLRLKQLGQKPLFGVSENPLPWLVSMLNGVEHGNFFETRVTDYSKAVTKGDWNDAYDF